MARGTAIVIGGGMVGAASALRLQQAGFATGLIAPETGRAPPSLGNAGHIAVEQYEPLASPKSVRSAWRRLFALGGPLDFPLRDIAVSAPFALKLLRASKPNTFAYGKRALTALLERAIPAWRRMAAEAGASDLVVEGGHFVVWESARSAARGKAAWAAMDHPLAAARPASATERADIAALTKADIAGAVRFERSGHIRDLPAMRGAILSAFEAAGGRRLFASVERLDLRGAEARIMTKDGGVHGADAIILAAGIASGALLKTVGVRIPIIAERGYHIECAGEGWPTTLPPIVFEDRAVVVTRFANTLRATSFVEFARDDSPPDPAKWRRLRRHVAELALPFEAPLSEWFGSRPTLPDYLPVIGRSAEAANLYYAFGHQHLGMTLAPATAELIAELASGEAPSLDLAPFDASRFRRA